MIFGKLIGQTPLGAGAQALTNLYNALPSATPLSDNAFPSVQQLHTRVTVLTATGAGTANSVVRIGGLLGFVSADFSPGSSAATFIANIAAWAQANFANIGQISADTQIVDNLNGTATITWNAGAAANALACTTDDAALSFANTVTGSDNTLVRSPLTAITGYLEYTALLTQSGVSVPTLTVLTNTTGETMSFDVYAAPGIYTLLATGSPFTATKTTCEISQPSQSGNSPFQWATVSGSNPGARTIQSGTVDVDGKAQNANDVLLNQVLTIKVYPS